MASRIDDVGPTPDEGNRRCALSRKCAGVGCAVEPPVEVLEWDGGETIDLAPQRPTEVLRLLAELAAWEHHMAEPRWTTGPRWRRNLLQKHTMSVIGREAERALP